MKSRRVGKNNTGSKQGSAVLIAVPKQLKVNDSTHKRLTDIARKDETYDEVINKCIDAYMREKERESKK